MGSTFEKPESQSQEIAHGPAWPGDRESEKSQPPVAR